MAEIKCPECGSDKVYKDAQHAEIVCRKCGAIIEEKIVDTSQEWRAFDHEQRSQPRANRELL